MARGIAESGINGPAVFKSGGFVVREAWKRGPKNIIPDVRPSEIAAVRRVAAGNGLGNGDRVATENIAVNGRSGLVDDGECFAQVVMECVADDVVPVVEPAGNVVHFIFEKNVSANHRTG